MPVSASLSRLRPGTQARGAASFPDPSVPRLTVARILWQVIVKPDLAQSAPARMEAALGSGRGSAARGSPIAGSCQSPPSVTCGRFSRSHAPCGGRRGRRPRLGPDWGDPPGAGAADTASAAPGNATRSGQRPGRFARKAERRRAHERLVPPAPRSGTGPGRSTGPLALPGGVGLRARTGARDPGRSVDGGLASRRCSRSRPRCRRRSPSSGSAWRLSESPAVTVDDGAPPRGATGRVGKPRLLGR
jgi:hypothetical protein